MTYEEAKLVDALKYWCDTNTECGVTHIPSSLLLKAIEALRESPRPKGRWIKTGAISCRCSECKFMPIENYTTYCPNCGANMQDDDELVKAGEQE